MTGASRLLSVSSCLHAPHTNGSPSGLRTVIFNTDGQIPNTTEVGFGAALPGGFTPPWDALCSIRVPFSRQPQPQGPSLGQGKPWGMASSRGCDGTFTPKRTDAWGQREARGEGLSATELRCPGTQPPPHSQDRGQREWGCGETPITVNPTPSAGFGMWLIPGCPVPIGPQSGAPVLPQPMPRAVP